MNNKTALEVNNISDTSKYMEQETDQMTDSSLSDKEQITNMTHSDNTNKSLEDKAADKYNKASNNSKDNTGKVNDFCKDITYTLDSFYMADTGNTDNTDSVDKDKDNKTESNRFDFRQYNASLTPEERRERARIAGIASGQARRERKTLGEQLKAILAQGDNQEQLCMALFKSALSGNYKAFNSLRDTIGEMPTQKQEVTASMTEGDRELLKNVERRLGTQNTTK